MSDESSLTAPAPEGRPSPLREIVQPFIDLAKAPRALWGVNLSYLLEGLVYFGWLTLLALSFNKNLGLDDHKADMMVGVFTGGITLAMLFLGGASDALGVRKAIVLSLAAMFIGRVVLVASGSLFPARQGLGSPMFWGSCVGLLGIVVGYGLYQPAAYAAVRRFTDERSSAMAYAMLYGLMNLGGFLPGLLSPAVRNAFERRARGASASDDMAARAGIDGVLWVYVALTLVNLAAFASILSRRTEREAIETARRLREAEKESGGGERPPAEQDAPARAKMSIGEWIRTHPLLNPKFTAFIFVFIPVQTLFAHNWLTLPQYVDRALGPVGHRYMELFVNLNPILIFVLTPIVTALSRTANVYRMMIAGTFVMAAPTFLLAMGPSIGLLVVYLVVSSVGEAMWQPRFLQYAAEIAPEGSTGVYMGVAQLPWFLTKVITASYAGWFLMKYCPEPGRGPQDTRTMWLVHACIAIGSTLLLLLAKGCLAKDFKTKAA